MDLYHQTKKIIGNNSVSKSIGDCGKLRTDLIYHRITFICMLPALIEAIPVIFLTLYNYLRDLVCR